MCSYSITLQFLVRQLAVEVLFCEDGMVPSALAYTPVSINSQQIIIRPPSFASPGGYLAAPCSHSKNVLPGILDSPLLQALDIITIFVYL